MKVRSPLKILIACFSNGAIPSVWWNLGCPTGQSGSDGVVERQADAQLEDSAATEGGQGASLRVYVCAIA